MNHLVTQSYNYLIPGSRFGQIYTNILRCAAWVIIIMHSEARGVYTASFITTTKISVSLDLFQPVLGS